MQQRGWRRLGDHLQGMAGVQALQALAIHHPQAQLVAAIGQGRPDGGRASEAAVQQQLALRPVGPELGAVALHARHGPTKEPHGSSADRRATRKKSGGEIGLFKFPPMIVAQVEIRGDIHLETRAIRWLYGSWLPKSGYVPDDHPAFEVWIGRPFAHGMEYFELYAHLPVKRG